MTIDMISSNCRNIYILTCIPSILSQNSGSILWIFPPSSQRFLLALLGSLYLGRGWFFVIILILCSNVTLFISSGFVIISPVSGWFIHVGTCGLFLGPRTLACIFQILAFGSFNLFSSIYSALKVSFSSLIISSKF